MEYIYCRVSTESQDNGNQLAKLTVLYPTAAVYQETCSTTKERPVLSRLLATLQKGDVLIIYSLDRLARKTSEALKIIEELDRRGVVLKSLRENVDQGSIAGRLVISILCSVAQMERELISERIKTALAAKREKGIVGGRRPTLDPAMVSKALEMRRRGDTLKAISKETGISESRIHQLSQKANIRWQKGKGGESDIPPTQAA